jgi:hypothetical protein
MSFLMNSKIYDLEIDVWREASANPQSETGTLAEHSGPINHFPIFKAINKSYTNHKSLSHP